MFDKIREFLRKGETPHKVVDAVVSPCGITIGRLALLEKAKCPILNCDIEQLSENVKATYLFSLPFSEAVEHLETAEKDSLVWADKIGWDEYGRKFTELANGIISFREMLPPIEKKKTVKNPSSETGGCAN